VCLAIDYVTALNSDNNHPPGLRGAVGEESRQRHEQVCRYMASSVIDFVSRCPKFDELAANNVCDMFELDSAAAVEFLAIQRGFLSLEAALPAFRLRTR
jgi:hypothetical protein